MGAGTLRKWGQNHFLNVTLCTVIYFSGSPFQHIVIERLQWGDVTECWSYCLSMNNTASDLIEQIGQKDVQIQFQQEIQNYIFKK